MCAGRIANIPIASLPRGSLTSMDLGGAIVLDCGPYPVSTVAVGGGALGPPIPGWKKAHKRPMGEASPPAEAAAAGVVLPTPVVVRRCYQPQRTGAASLGVPPQAAACSLLPTPTVPERGSVLRPCQRGDDSSQQLPHCWTGGWPAAGDAGPAEVMKFPSGGVSSAPAVAWLQAACCDSDGPHAAGVWQQPYAVLQQPRAPLQQQQYMPYSENGLFVSMAADATTASAASPDIYELLSEFGGASPSPSPGEDLLGCSPPAWGDDGGSGATGSGSRGRGGSSSAETVLVQWAAGSVHEGIELPAAAAGEASGKAASHWITTPDEGAQSAMELFAHWADEGEDFDACGLYR